MLLAKWKPLNQDNSADRKREGLSASASGRRFQLSGLIASIGPGLVYSLTVLGAGDVVSNTAAGASYRYHLIWALGMSLIFRYVWVNTSAKYVLVSGESLLTGYGRVGRWIPLVVLLGLLPIRHFENQFLVLMTGSAAHLLFPLPSEWSKEIWACLARLKAAGQAILVIDKNVDDMVDIADRHYIIEKGRIAWSGTSPELLGDKRVMDRFLGV